MNRPASTWSDTRLVAGREVEEKLRSRAFLLSTLFFLVVVAASVALPALLAGGGPSRYDVATVGPQAEALVQGVPSEQVELSARAVTGADAAQALLREESVDAAVEVGPDGLVLTARQRVPEDLREALLATTVRTELVGFAESNDVPVGEVERLLSPPVREVLLDDRGLDPAVVPLLTIAFAMLFFFVVLQFGLAIAQGVVQEKESRIVELLVSAVPVRTLLAGKVLGLGLLALGQVVLIVVVAIAGAALTGERELLWLFVRNSGWFLLFFVLGFLLLSCLWAAAGAFASRTEELQSTTTPLTVLLIGPLFAAVYVTDGAARTALSFVPFTAPLMMPARLLEGDAAAWEAAVSALVLLGSCVVSVRVGERLYRSSLLRTRGRTSLKDAWSGRVGSAP